jgi:ATP/ADP translocase
MDDPVILTILPHQGRTVGYICVALFILVALWIWNMADANQQPRKGRPR